MNKRLIGYNLNVIALALYCFHYCSCKEPSEEKPIKRFQDDFHKSSAERYRKLYADEAEYIEAYIRKHPNKKYKKIISGFWIHSSEGHSVEKTSDRNGDEIYFTYSIQDLNGQAIYREYEIGLQKIHPDKALVIRGIEEALKKIQEGENCELLLPSFFAYGISGDGNKIWSNQPIIVQIKRLKNSKK